MDSRREPPHAPHRRGDGRQGLQDLPHLREGAGVSGFSALVLAGSRGGPDPVAQAAGVSHKGLATVGGETLLARVVGALMLAGAERIAVSTSDPEIEAAAVAMASAGGAVFIELLPATGSPSQSVADAFAALGAPLLVTTVDHALLQAEWVAQFLADTPTDADIAALLAPEAIVRADVPDTQRTWLKLRDGRYSGCNLFYLASGRAVRAVELWRTVERHRKQPWKIAAVLGIDMLAQYLAGRLTLDEAIARLGARAGVTAAAVRSRYGLAAVDVDKPADLQLVRRIAAAQAAAGRPPASGG
ncbi:MAG: nucleotidyltransferase family protein [Caulobacteraceae bacterium]|nr:nucleotidyltransferase family protein [Caulobacteraceae bacterium]